MDTPNMIPQLGVIWFLENGLPFIPVFFERVFTTIGRKDDKKEVELPVKEETSNLPLWNTFIANEVSSKYLFWEYPTQRNIDRVKRTEFPAPTIGSVALVIDANWSSNILGQKQIMSHQALTLCGIACCMEDMGIPLLILCLRQKEQGTSAEELLGALLSFPHIEVAAYHIDKLSDLNSRLLDFLTRAEERATNRKF